MLFDGVKRKMAKKCKLVSRCPHLKRNPHEDMYSQMLHQKEQEELRKTIHYLKAENDVLRQEREALQECLSKRLKENRPA